MKIISHRGNINGENPSMENKPEYILKALEEGFDVEIDVWKIGLNLLLGHDNPSNTIDFNFLSTPGLWIHCKNIECIEYLININRLNIFWHQKDDIAMTSNKFLWTYPGKKLTSKSIAVLPEKTFDWNIENAYGVCTNYPLKYKK